MGLLEVDTSNLDYTSEDARFLQPRSRPAFRPWRTRIEFLHRTVRDYFATSAGSLLLRQYTDAPFDAHLFRCNLLITNMTAKDVSDPPHLMKLDSAETFLVQIQSRPPGEVAAFLLFEKMVALIDSQYDVLRQYVPFTRHRSLLEQRLTCWVPDHGNAMSFAVELGWTTYVESRLTVTMQKIGGRPLLDYALRPASRKQSHWDIINILLHGGACPDATLEDGVPQWAYFLMSLHVALDVNPKSCLDIIKVLITHGTSTRVGPDQMNWILQGNEFDELAVHAAFQNGDIFGHQPVPAKNPYTSLLRTGDSANNVTAKNDEGLLSFMDVLQILQQWSKGRDEKVRLLSEDDMAMLKSIAETAEHNCGPV